MKALKTNLTIVAAVLLIVALGLVIMPQECAGDGERGPDARQDYSAPDAPQYAEAAVSDSALPSAKPPVLRIGAKEDPNVYLQSLDIQVEVTGNIASTRYTMVFRNNTDRLLEGELTFPLPDGRTVTHYALDINGKMRDAVPVEKARATQVFEEIQQREVDPGVLERVEGNNYRTRIYPFPRRGTRTISIGYEEELSLENGLLYYRLPMAYPNALEKFGVTATVWNTSRKPLVPQSEDELLFDRAGENYVAAFAGENYRPSRALIFALPAPVNIPQVVMQSAQGSRYFLASVAPKPETRKKQWSDELAVIWDVSLSGSQRNQEHEMKMLDVIFADKKNANVHLYFLNNRLKKIADKNSSGGGYKIVKGNWKGLKNTLETAVFDGGTDFSQINLKDIKGDEILFFSDGISTLSDADFLKDTKSDVNRPIHCIVSSSSADYSAMKLIAGKTKGKFININALSCEKLKDELLNETLQFLGVEHGTSVREVHPSISTPVQGNFSVAGISSGNDADVTLLFGFGGKVEKRMKVKLDAGKAGSQGKVYRIWAQKKIEELDLDFNKNRAELTELGKQFGIVTRNTSLIVLETMDDYVRFSIEPPTSEPEMRATYHQRRKGHERDMRDTESTMLADAMSTAQSMRKWWDTEFKLPKEPKYPVPDGDQYAGAESGSQSRGSQTKRAVGEPEFFESLPERKTSDGSGEGRKGMAGIGYGSGYGSGFGGSGGGIDDLLGGLAGGSAGASQGGGDPRARVTQQGVLGTVSGSIKGKSVASADIFGKGGFATDVDAILSGVGGLKSGGDGGTARQGTAGIAIGSGVGSGFGGSGGGIDELLNGSLMSGNSGELVLKRRGELKVSSPDFLKGGSLTGGRSHNSAYLRGMTGKTADDYQEYLKLRDENNHVNTPKFYFDMAAWFYKHNDKETALRILTSIAELELENAPLYRMLGYRFKEYGEHALQKFVCKKVMEWRPMEPQGYRDYALALADNGEAQAALDSLYGLLTKSYSTHIGNRSRGMEEVVITEINRLIAKNPRLSSSRIDRRLKMNTPADVRVVLNWNMNNINVDLSVIDPTGEEAAYSLGGRFNTCTCSACVASRTGGKELTTIGGRLSADNRSGYGPEQFVLKKAAKGKYRVYATYQSAREFAAAGPITVMAEIYTKYGSKDEQRRVVTMQLSGDQGSWNSWGRWTGGSGGKVLVGEFDFFHISATQTR